MVSLSGVRGGAKEEHAAVERDGLRARIAADRDSETTAAASLDGAVPRPQSRPEARAPGA